MDNKLKDLFINKIIDISKRKSQVNIHALSYMLGLIERIQLTNKQVRSFLKRKKIPKNIMYDELRTLLRINQ